MMVATWRAPPLVWGAEGGVDIEERRDEEVVNTTSGGETKDVVEKEAGLFDEVYREGNTDRDGDDNDDRYRNLMENLVDAAKGKQRCVLQHCIT